MSQKESSVQDLGASKSKEGTQGAGSGDDVSVASSKTVAQKPSSAAAARFDALALAAAQQGATDKASVSSAKSKAKKRRPKQLHLKFKVLDMFPPSLPTQAQSQMFLF